MPWVKLDDGFFINPKARAAGLEGRALYLASLCWCAMQMNDGTFPASDVHTVAALAGVPDETAGRLSPFLWHPEGHDCATCRAAGQAMPVPSGHVTVHEYLKDNPSRQQIVAEREAAAERKRRSRLASRRDSDGTDAATSPASSPSPTDKTILSSNGHSRPHPQPVDDDVPAAVWERYAELKLAAELRRKPGSISNHTSWKRTTARNAATEHGETAAHWWADYDVTPQRLAECVIDGKAPGPQYRRKSPA